MASAAPATVTRLVSGRSEQSSNTVQRVMFVDWPGASENGSMPGQLKAASTGSETVMPVSGTSPLLRTVTVKVTGCGLPSSGNTRNCGLDSRVGTASGDEADFSQVMAASRTRATAKSLSLTVWPVSELWPVAVTTLVVLLQWVTLLTMTENVPPGWRTVGNIPLRSMRLSITVTFVSVMPAVQLLMVMR